MIPRVLDPAVADALKNNPGRIGAFVEISFPSGWARIHSRLGERVYKGQSYFGVGELGGISALTASGSNSANRMRFSLKVLDASLLNTVINEDPNGRECFIHLVAFDENAQIIGGEDYFFDGNVADMPIAKGDTKNNVPAVINIVSSDWFERWATAPNPERTTDNAQKAKYPDDDFFNMTEIIASTPLSGLPFKNDSNTSGARSNSGSGGGTGGGDSGGGGNDGNPYINP